ncbi:spore germination protein [Bacillus sp. ISL-46]|nr:spore germination protein [Bacillus sp. ISL-46]MBT2721438.1 spore germination protein [Bacillus sp. ISL-46]
MEMEKDIDKDISINIEKIKKRFHNTSDLKFREIKLGYVNTTLIIVFIDGIIDSDMLEDSVILRITDTFNNEKAAKGKNLIESLTEKVLTTPSVTTLKSLDKLADAIIQGNAVIVIDGFQEAISVNVTKWKERSLEESLGERALKGVMIGFTERASTNISIVRSIIKTEDFCVTKKTLGTKSKTDVYLLYIEGIVDKDILKEVQKRVDALTIKYLLDTFVIEEALKGKPKTFFPLTLPSERPDVVSSALLEGRVTIIVDGSPKVIITPALFEDFLQSPDEYYTSYGRFSIRFIRLMSFIISLFLPGVYVSLDHIDKKRISKKVYEIFITKDEFLPTFLEVFILLILLRIILDASVRMPKGIALTISFLASILIGQTAVEAKLVHPVSILVVGITVIISMVLGNKGLNGAIITIRATFRYYGDNRGSNIIIRIYD